MQGRKIFYIRLILVICILINCITIFKFSSENSEISTSRSRNFISIFINKSVDDTGKEEIINNVETIIRKLAHVFIYTCLGFLIANYINTYNTKNKTIIKTTIILGYIYSCLDEIHQLFIPGRSGAFIDTCIDTLGLIIGIMIFLCVRWLVLQYKNMKNGKINNITEKKEDKKKVLFISSTGGHLSELLNLSPLFEEYDYTIVTEKNNISLNEKYPNRVEYLKYGTKKNLLKYIYIFTANCIKSFKILFKKTPDVIVTTGTHTAVPMCYIAKILFGKKIIYIETFANIETKTVAGRLVYPISDVFVVQWKELQKKYPKSVCWGGIY